MVDAAGKTFSSFDKFGLKPFADKLTDYLLTECQFVEGSYVLSLNSEFGSGKTTFFQMWGNKLATAESSPQVVYLNAWESDFQGDPLLAVVSALLERLEPEKADSTTKAIKETAGQLCRFGLSVGNDVVQKCTGIDLMKAAQYAQRETAGTESELGLACFQLYREKQGLLAQLRSLLAGFAATADAPIFVFVDELDRCRPTYAIDFLETIKHFFDIDRLVFVLGVDKRQLAASARSLFGQQLDFDEYYRKFAHRNVTLPVKSAPVTARFARALVQEYFTEEAYNKKKKFPYIKQDQYRTGDIAELCAALSLNARQVHELFRTSAHVFSATKREQTYLLWGWQAATAFMTALSLKREDLYHALGRKEIALEHFADRFKDLALWRENRRAGFCWAALVYVGAYGNEPVGKLETEFQKLGLWDRSGQDEKAFENEMAKFAQGYGHWEPDGGKVFERIYEILEGLRTFAEG